MQKLILREHYPEAYNVDTFVEVSDDVFDVFAADKRAEEAYKRKLYRYGAHFSLDCNDGIEKAVAHPPPTPEEIFEQKLLCEQLLAAVSSLPEKQFRRIYSKYFLGMTPNEIASAERVAVRRVRDSIRRGLKTLSKLFSENYLK